MQVTLPRGAVLFPGSRAGCCLRALSCQFPLGTVLTGQSYLSKTACSQQLAVAFGREPSFLQPHLFPSLPSMGGCGSQERFLTNVLSSLFPKETLALQWESREILTCSQSDWGQASSPFRTGPLFTVHKGWYYCFLYSSKWHFFIELILACYTTWVSDGWA